MVERGINPTDELFNQAYAMTRGSISDYFNQKREEVKNNVD